MVESTLGHYLWMSGQKRSPADKKYRHDNMAGPGIALFSSYLYLYRRKTCGNYCWRNI